MSASSPSLPGATIADAARSTREFSRLAAAVQAAELVDTLASPGPFTVFAPTDAAFSKLPEGALERLLRPENRVALASFVTRHILAGRLTAAELRERAVENDGQIALRTVANDMVKVEPREDGLHVLDASGHDVTVTAADLLQSNGVIHVTDTVLAPAPC